jgi:hypothetical protein
MIKRVADALATETVRQWKATPREQFNPARAARAAIEAMREPSRDMMKSGDRALAVVGAFSEQVWLAMIDAALEDGSDPGRT